jgi:hypothetical protein
MGRLDGYGRGFFSRTRTSRDLTYAHIYAVAPCPRMCERDLNRFQGYAVKRLDRRKVMSIIAWLILGLIAGFIGSKIVNRSGEGILLDIGLAGSWFVIRG